MRLQDVVWDLHTVGGKVKKEKQKVYASHETEISQIYVETDVS